MPGRRVRSVATHFLNVDLDIYSRSDLQPLVERIGKSVAVLYVGRERRKYSAHLELAKDLRTADAAIRSFCRLISALPKTERALWDSATIRSFSIGIQSGPEPRALDFVVRSETLRVLSELDAQVVVTVYAPEQSI